LLLGASSDGDPSRQQGGEEEAVHDLLQRVGDRASADQLDAIEDASVDVVTARSVLIYLDDKQPAFTEMFRVLKPGGRISLFEPINRFGSPGPSTSSLASMCAPSSA